MVSRRSHRPPPPLFSVLIEPGKQFIVMDLTFQSRSWGMLLLIFLWLSIFVIVMLYVDIIIIFDFLFDMYISLFLVVWSSCIYIYIFKLSFVFCSVHKFREIIVCITPCHNMNTNEQCLMNTLLYLIIITSFTYVVYLQ